MFALGLDLKQKQEASPSVQTGEGKLVPCPNIRQKFHIVSHLDVTEDLCEVLSVTHVTSALTSSSSGDGR